MVGLFIFFDHMGPLKLAPGISRALDIKPHPHIGLSTVTYLYQGSLTHRDSLGFTQEIRPGEVNWMTAGKGVTHSERFEYARIHGVNMHGIQAWVALPKENEDDDPEFIHYTGAMALPEWHDKGISARLIAGSLDGLHAQVKTHSPIFYLHLNMNPNAQYSLNAQYRERAVYVAQGGVEVDGHRLYMGQMVVLRPGRINRIKAIEKSIVMLLGGEPVGKRFIYWNFVSSSKKRIEEAKADWQANKMKLPVGDDQEFVPLP